MSAPKFTVAIEYASGDVRFVRWDGLLCVEYQHARRFSRRDADEMARRYRKLGTYGPTVKAEEVQS